MFKHLFVLLVLVAATVAVSSTARATTLTIDYLVCQPSGNYAECAAPASGGTGGYTYHWSNSRSTGEVALVYCVGTRRYYQGVTVTVTDSSGTTASRTTRFLCSGYA